VSGSQTPAVSSIEAGLEGEAGLAGDPPHGRLDAAHGIDKIGSLAASAGIGRIHMLSWRDLADHEAGGSEVHSDNIARLWAQAGIEVTIRTSRVQGLPADTRRAGCRLIRRGGRLSVFPKAALAELTGRHGPRDALVEIWNGIPFLSPLWARGPRTAWLHHIHTDVWPLFLPPYLARTGHFVEQRLAPPLYRRTPIVTLSQSARRGLLERVRLRPDNVFVVEPGVSAEFAPGGERADVPTVLAVGRLKPQKALHVLVNAVADLQDSLPGARLVIIGEGYLRDDIERLISERGMQELVDLTGRVSRRELLNRYRSAWVLASASRAEGWGMSITEAAACATPAVVSDIPGHADAVDQGVSGILVDSDDDFAPALAALLSDPGRRERLGAAALARAAELSWERTAHDTLAVLAGKPPTRADDAGDKQETATDSTVTSCNVGASQDPAEPAARIKAASASDGAEEGPAAKTKAADGAATPRR